MYKVQLFFRKEAHEYLGWDQHLPLDSFYIDKIKSGNSLGVIASYIYQNGYHFLKDNGNGVYYPPEVILFIVVYKD